MGSNLTLSSTAPLIFLYLIIGFYLSYVSFNIAYERFPTKKMPIFLILIICLFIDFTCLLAASIINAHFGLFIILVTIIPYLAVRRQHQLGAD